MKFFTFGWQSINDTLAAIYAINTYNFQNTKQRLCGLLNLPLKAPHPEYFVSLASELRGYTAVLDGTVDSCWHFTPQSAHLLRVSVCSKLTHMFYSRVTEKRASI